MIYALIVIAVLTILMPPTKKNFDLLNKIIYLYQKKKDMMNLEKTIGLDKLTGDERMARVGEIAELLFPGHKHPRHALRRILHGEGSLSTGQISKLAMHLDITESELFEGIEWKGRATKNRLFLNSEDYTAILNTKTCEVRVLSKKTLACKRGTIPPSMPLSGFIKTLQSLIDFK